MIRNIAVLGSTGSIGRQTLEVVREHPEHFRVVALAAGNNLDLLDEQVREFKPLIVSTGSECERDRYPGCELYCSDDGLMEVATCDVAELIVVATSGHSSMKPTLAAVEAGKTIALANKEVVVCAGALLMPLAETYQTEIRPIDSEHSAIWQCLMARSANDQPRKVTLTASGGALRDVPINDLPDVVAEQALAHPNWVMGPKVTIDSASLMNKGLEVIEAHWLFSTAYDDIDVVIHPQSIIHSMVSYDDGSTIAQLGIPDMRVPIQYALSYPERLSANDRHLDLASMGMLEFAPPDLNRYPLLQVAYDAGRAGSTYPTVLSAADEVAVDAFLQHRIRFGEMVDIVRSVVDAHDPDSGDISLNQIEEADRWARTEALKQIKRIEDR